MGRKKRTAEEVAAAAAAAAPSAASQAASRDKSVGSKDEDSDDEPYEDAPKHYDIDPDIQELAYTFNIDPGLTQRLNDLMLGERQRTWEQDLARLYEILKDAHTPAAMLNLKLRDMEKGTFVGKAKCQSKVRELASKHRLDKGASTKLEEAMSMREAMGKDVEKDLYLLDEHLAASNAPSKLVSMKLDSLRKGFNIGHCIYSREPMPGNQGPGVDGVFDKRGGKRTLGYTDADLDRRFAEQDLPGAGGQLMDEATVRRLMAAERKSHEAKMTVREVPEEAPQESQSEGRTSNRSRSRGRRAGGGRSRRRSPAPAGGRRRTAPSRSVSGRGRSAKPMAPCRFPAGKRRQRLRTPHGTYAFVFLLLACQASWVITASFVGRSCFRSQLDLPRTGRRAESRAEVVDAVVLDTGGTDTSEEGGWSRPPPLSSAAELRAALLNRIRPLDRGRKASQEDVEDISRLARELGDAAKEAGRWRLEFPRDLDQLEGRWTLLYTSAFASPLSGGGGTLGGLRPGPPLENPVVEVGDILQRYRVNASSAETIVQLQPPRWLQESGVLEGVPFLGSNPETVVTLTQQFEVAGNDSLRFAFLEGEVDNSGALEMLRPFKFPMTLFGLPPETSRDTPVTDTLITTYCDEELRIGIGGRFGEVRVFLRK